MGPEALQLALGAAVVGLLLVAANRWAKHQHAAVRDLEPPPSLQAVGSWEDEVRAAQQAADAAREATERSASERPEPS